MKRTDPQHKLGAVLLAAGGSSRLGRPKQLLRVEGEALVARVVRRLTEVEPDSLVVVTGSSSRLVEDELTGMPIQIVSNPRWEEGMAGSLATGVKKLPIGIEGVLIMLCDQWRVEHADLQALVQSWNTDISRIAAASWLEDGKRVIGPPAIFPTSLLEELTTLKGDRGARVVIGKHSDLVSLVAMKNARFDLDKPADLEEFPGLT